MRLILLPLAPGKSLLYGQQSILPRVRTTKRLDEKFLDRATKTWQGFENSNTGWKKMLVKWSNKALERIPYSEWSLRTIPATDMYQRKVKDAYRAEFPHHIAPAEIKNYEAVEPVQLVHVGDDKEAIESVRRLASAGLEHHKKYMWRSIVGIPFTAPFAIIPIVPNIPFFYMAFRLYCHWQAYQGAKHLQYLLDKNQLAPVHLAALDATFEHHKDQVEARLGKIFMSPQLDAELKRAQFQLAKEAKEQDAERAEK